MADGEDMQLTHAIVKDMTNGRGKDSNINSVVVALNNYGERFGMLKPHRIAQIFAQIMHESAYFVYDRELWNGKGAQARYDIRTDLGNTPERDGDGEKYKGHGPIQVTGKYNHGKFRDWVRGFIPDCPDFVAHPELINTDPYEGLTIVWYWSTRPMNKLADENNLYHITKLVNGGYNGLSHRYECYDAAALVLLGFSHNDVRGFQKSAGIAVDGESGPQTRKALHMALVLLSHADPHVIAAEKVAPKVPEIVAPTTQLQPQPEPLKPQRASPLQSTTIWAVIKQWGASLGPMGYGVWSALQEQDATTRAVILGGLFLVALYIAHLGRHIIRERMRKWSEGIR